MEELIEVLEAEPKASWCFPKLNELFSFVIGGDWGKGPDEDLGPDYEQVYCIRGSELRNWNQEKGSSASLRIVKASSLAKRKLEIGDILLEISGGGPEQPVGRTVLIDEDVLAFEPGTPKVCTNFLRLLRLTDQVDKKYINYYLTFFYHSGEVVKYQGGSNNLRNLKFDEYSDITIPLPPFSEQKRIVRKLDALMEKEEAARERLEAIPEILKQFRQRVLVHAVSGKLTEEWRREKSLDFSTWKCGKIKDFFYLVKDKVVPTDDSLDYIGLEHLEKDGGIVKVGNSNGLKSAKGVFKKGDILYGKLRPYLNKHAVVEFDGVCSTDIIIYRPKPTALPQYLDYILSLPEFISYAVGHSKGINLPRVAPGTVDVFEVKVPSVEEQKEIVRKVEELFTWAHNVEEAYARAMEKLENLPQALLAKAFRGELVPQNPADEPASVLLERIQAERAKQQKGKSPQKD